MKDRPLAYITESTVEDLLKLYGATRDELIAMGFAIVNDPPADAAAIVCAVHKPGAPLILPDNVIGPCAFGCGRTLQWRPKAPAHLPRVCEFCAITLPKESN